MKRLAALLASTSVLAACGGTVEETAVPDQRAPQARLLAAPIGAPQPYERPGGIHAADGRSYYALADGELRRISTLTGKSTKSYALDGEWELTGVSATGAWVALQRPRGQGEGVEIAVLDTKTGAEAHRVELRGDFRVETVSAAGDFLFLQQNFVDGSYAVRGYDLGAGQLLPGSLGTKGEVVQMQGLASQVVASPDGRWLLTLYVNTQTNTAFVHALNLIERVAICINMPPCTDCSRRALKKWALALSPDGSTLFAANPSLGSVATIDLATTQVVAQSRFRPSAGGETRAELTKDGSQLVFTNGRTTWSFDPSSNLIDRLAGEA